MSFNVLVIPEDFTKDEHILKPLVQAVLCENVISLPHQGRKKLMAAAVKNWNRIRGRCPEETTSLAQRIKALL